jgi:hypothetical protein
MARSARNDANEIPRRIMEIKFLDSIDKCLLVRSEIATKHGDLLAARIYQINIALNKAGIERLRNVGPNIRIFL